MTCHGPPFSQILRSNIENEGEYLYLDRIMLLQRDWGLFKKTLQIHLNRRAMFLFKKLPTLKPPQRFWKFHDLPSDKRKQFVLTKITPNFLDLVNYPFGNGKNCHVIQWEIGKWSFNKSQASTVPIENNLPFREANFFAIRSKIGFQEKYDWENHQYECQERWTEISRLCLIKISLHHVTKHHLG